MDPSKHAPLRINDIRSKYKVIDKVGKGTYGTVFKVLNLQDNKYYAIKKFQNTDIKLQVEGFPITALREISLLKQLNHPNIVNLQEIICSKPNKRNLFRGSTFMVFEYMHHDFAGLLRSKIKFSMPQIKCMMKQLLLGCSFLHKNKVMHRDIKSANILLNDQGIVQLADFGLGRRTRFESVYTYKVVTLWYRAPELLLGCKTYNHKVDVWSIGCVFAELLTGQVLFKKQTQYAIIQKIYEVCGDLQENEFTEDYLRGCVYYNDMRPKKSFKNTLTAFVKKMNPNIDDLSINFLQGLLELNPYKRLSCDQALEHEFFKTQPKACEPQQIHKLQVQYHEMFRDRSLKIDRKARKQSLNWSEEEQLKKGKQQKSVSQEMKTSRYPERDNKVYPPRDYKQKSYNDRSYERKSYNTYESRYDDRKRDYVPREYPSKNYEDQRPKKRYSKSRSHSHSHSSSSSSSKSQRSRSRNNKKYEDKGREYTRKDEREKGQIALVKKESKYYDDSKKSKERSYEVKEKIPEYNIKSYQQKTQSYKKQYYQQESKYYKERSYDIRDKQRKDYPRNQYDDKKQYTSRSDKYSRSQYQRSYQKSEPKQRYPEVSKQKSYRNDKYESGDYRSKDQYKKRQEIKQDFKYDQGRRDDERKTYKDDYDRYSKPYSKQYRPEYSKKQYYPSGKTENYSDDRRSYEKSREKQDRDDKVSRQYKKEPYDYSKKSSRYSENYRYKEDYRYQDQPRHRDNYRDDSKYRDESRYRNDEKNKELLTKKVSIQSRQSTQKKKSSPKNKAMDVQQQY